MILDENEFKKRGFKGEIEKKDFMEELKDTLSPDEISSLKIAEAFNQIKDILLKIGLNIENFDNDFFNLQKESMAALALNAKAISQIEKLINEMPQRPMNQWKVLKAHFKRDALGRIKSPLVLEKE